jgi:hypothetical protein
LEEETDDAFVVDDDEFKIVGRCFVQLWATKALENLTRLDDEKTISSNTESDGRWW